MSSFLSGLFRNRKFQFIDGVLSVSTMLYGLYSAQWWLVGLGLLGLLAVRIDKVKLLRAYLVFISLCRRI